MSLLLYHPEVAYRPCEDCKAWVYDSKTGERMKRGGKDVPRPKGIPTPCSTCPKKSPQEARHYELSAKNWQALEMYLQTQATFGLSLPKRVAQDPIVRKNMGIIGWVFSQHQRNQQQLQGIAPLLALANLKKS